MRVEKHEEHRVSLHAKLACKLHVVQFTIENDKI